ncbi:MAG: hypothetical protein R6U43_03030 [Candidatus Krumholzibacteriales bacterium]
MKRLLKILATAAVHLIVTIWSVMKTFQMSGFFFGVYPRPYEGPFRSFITNLSRVLLFPLGNLAMRLPADAEFAGWTLVIINSLLWALILYYAVHGILAVAAKSHQSGN